MLGPRSRRAKGRATVYTMPHPKLDSVKFMVHQRKDDPTEITAHIIIEDEYDKICEYMEEGGYALCEAIRGSPFEAKTGEYFFIKVTGDIKINTFGDHSYRKDRLELQYLRNRTNRKDFFTKGTYRGRFQPEFAGRVLLHRMTLNAGMLNKGSGRQYSLNNLESVIGNSVSSAKLVLPKVREDPAPVEIQDAFEEDMLVKDVVLRTISKDIPKDFVVPLAMHLFGLTEVEILNMNVLPRHRDFDEQRYVLLEKWKLTKGIDATFAKLIGAFNAVKMTSPAKNLDRNLLTDLRLRKAGKALPGDLKPFADIIGVNVDEVERKFYCEMAEHKFQVLYRWREDTHLKLKRRANHSRLLKALRYTGMEDVAEKATEINSVDARDVDILRIITKDLDRDLILDIATRLGLTKDDIDEILKELGEDFNKRLFLLNTLVRWKDAEDPERRPTFENVIDTLKSMGLHMNASILSEFLVNDKRIRILAPLINDTLIHDLADELRVDTTPMMIPRGGAAANLGYRLLLRWMETRGKYASHTELINALGKAELDNVAKDIDEMGSVSIKRGAMSDFCLRYVSSWVHVSRAHEWPSIVQNIPSDLITGLDSRTVQQIRRTIRDPREQMAKAFILCRDRKIIKSAGTLCNRLVACGFEKAALTLLDIAQAQYYCTTLRLDDAEGEEEEE